ncbi:hypothetical protein [Dongshaea marina]|uniref:hypothetical protein n=1 Tax=Dongshaea marina TaxID=2047966 RepID=UPI000D3E81C8|nr:hypothetical protein [Dongshaea marina]
MNKSFVIASFALFISVICTNASAAEFIGHNTTYNIPGHVNGVSVDNLQQGLNALKDVSIAPDVMVTLRLNQDYSDSSEIVVSNPNGDRIKIDGNNHSITFHKNGIVIDHGHVLGLVDNLTLKLKRFGGVGCAIKSDHGSFARVGRGVKTLGFQYGGVCALNDSLVIVTSGMDASHSCSATSSTFCAGFRAQEHSTIIANGTISSFNKNGYFAYNDSRIYAYRSSASNNRYSNYDGAGVAH